MAVLLMSLMACQSGSQKSTKSETIYETVDAMPIFPGGDEALIRYIAENVVYPETAKAAGIQGKVIVKFCVTSEGKVDKCEIFKSVNNEIDFEALRVIKSFPQFTEPAKKDGENVAVWYLIPINFTLK